MELKTEYYNIQKQRWPDQGKHILAHFDDESIIVYQAYREAIGIYAIENGYFGGPFSLNRMTWIKPNFLWMMYRSGWGTEIGQEFVLGIRLAREFFNKIVEQAVPSTYQSDLFESKQEWKKAVTRSEVRLQWDPDHKSNGHKCERRAIQLGLRGEMIRSYAKEQILEIIDMRDFVAQQRNNVAENNGKLILPIEKVYHSIS